MADLKFAIVFTAIDHASAAIARIGAEFDAISKRAQTAAERWNATATRWKDTGKNMVVSGAEMVAPGAAVALLGKKVVETTEDFENHIARLGASLGNIPDKAKQLATAEEWIKKASVDTGYGVDELVESLYQGSSASLTISQSMAVSTAAAKLARATSGDLAQTTSFLTTAMRNFSDPTKTMTQNATILADKMAVLQTQFKFTDLNELTSAMGYAAPQAKALKIPLDQALASMAAFSMAGETGSEAGTRFVELSGQLLKAAPKLGIQIFRNANGEGLDFIRTMEGIRAKFGDISRDPRMAARFEKAFGLRAGPALALLLGNLDQAKAAMAAVGHATGAAGRAEQEFEKRGTLGWSKLGAAIRVLEIDIGEKLAPSLANIAKQLTEVVNSIAAFTTAHPALVSTGLKILAIGAGLSLVGGAVSIVAGGFLMTGSAALKISAGIFRVGRVLTDVSGLTLRFVGAWNKIGDIANTVGIFGRAVASAAVSVYEFAAAQFSSAISGIVGMGRAIIAALPAIWAFNVALLANPITGIIAGVIALGVAAYEIYKHWDKIAPFFEHLWSSVKASFGAAIGWIKAHAAILGEAALALTGVGLWAIAIVEIYKHWDKIKEIFHKIVDWMKTAGLDMMKSLGEGILTGVEYPFKAAWSAAKKIGDLFHFHSPPVEGPLREAILNFRFSEELANRIKPAPVIAPARETAAGTASAAWDATGKISGLFRFPLSPAIAPAVAPAIAPIAGIVLAPVIAPARETAAGTVTTAAPHAAPAAGGITVNLTYSPTINGGSPDEWIKAARQHADELMRIIDSKLNRRQRLAFE